ncbi:hypothetical protein GH714_033884 [Hevea brasiliensis]|uniref:Uncharacterized protein n=1 Tax=Hevea brasiliensis TaxID=3981 RepID=A0A6A6N6Z5_HEVBR|nr:hypothetical protein GH714_033884 [Hevea brasiliensis]
MEGEVLGKFNKAKFSENSGIDKRPFEVIDLSQEEEITDANKQIVDTLFGINLSSVGGSKENDRIQSLPGQPKALVAHLWLMEQWKSLDHLEYIVMAKHFITTNFHGMTSRECNLASGKADHDTADIDIYNIYWPLCHNGNLTAKPKQASLAYFDPCSDYYACLFHTPEVQEAMHANVTKLNHDWEPCSDILDSWKDSPSTVIPLLQEFMANGLRVWIYSGDTDGRVPVTSTQYSIAK